MKVFVYRNVRKRKWSVRAMEGPRKGRVIKHLDELMLTTALFKVSEAGRQRVIREGRKNVHAGVIGYLSFDKQLCTKLVTYRPYLRPTFYRVGTCTPVYTADYVRFDKWGQVWI